MQASMNKERSTYCRRGTEKAIAFQAFMGQALSIHSRCIPREAYNSCLQESANGVWKITHAKQIVHQLLLHSKKYSQSTSTKQIQRPSYFVAPNLPKYVPSHRAMPFPKSSRVPAATSLPRVQSCPPAVVAVFLEAPVTFQGSV